MDHSFDAPSFDAIVVLGAALHPDGTPTPALARRVEHGVSLFGKGRARRLIMVGGYGRALPPPPVSEAQAMRALALAAGVPGDRIVTEDVSSRTIENAHYTKRLMDANGWRRALLVTDAFHMRRALYTFRRFGIDVEASPAGRRQGDSRMHWVAAHVRETVALAVYIGLFASGRAEVIAAGPESR
jgi:uncharacterized SAM-binding protein YcdF (DUF218 family)